MGLEPDQLCGGAGGRLWRTVALLEVAFRVWHADVATTMRYVDVSEDDQRDAIATVFGAFGRQVGVKTGETGSMEAISVGEMK